jgi:hypothetical protein
MAETGAGFYPARRPSITAKVHAERMQSGPRRHPVRQRDPRREPAPAGEMLSGRQRTKIRTCPDFSDITVSLCRGPMRDSRARKHPPSSTAGGPLLDPGGHHTLAVSLRRQIAAPLVKILPGGGFWHLHSGGENRHNSGRVCLGVGRLWWHRRAILAFRIPLPVPITRGRIRGFREHSQGWKAVTWRRNGRLSLAIGGTMPFLCALAACVRL